MFRVNKSEKVAYNNGVEQITVSDKSANSLYITYLYSSLSGALSRAGGYGELILGGERAALRINGGNGEVAELLKERLAEIVGIGYKYVFLNENLRVALSRRDKKLLCAALIAADFEGDKGYIVRKIGDSAEYSVDGIYSFRLKSLQEKWRRIVDYVPDGFSGSDLKQFCDFLVGESKNKVYLKGKTVFGENLRPLKRSCLLGEEDVETEIMLSDAGFVYCLGEIEDEIGDFLQKFYAERAIFS